MAAARAARRRGPGQLEDEVVATVAAADVALTPGEVLDRLGEELAYTTVLTVLTRLHQKGMLSRERAGRHAFAYALITPEVRIARSMANALDGSPDRDLALARFVDTLAPGDIPVLRKLLSELENW